MWLWLDDVRRPPSNYEWWAKTVDEAIEYLSTGKVTHCSLDHDLADEHYKSIGGYGEAALDRSRYKERTGYDVIRWMVETGNWCADITIHTMNPAGRRDMTNLLANRAPEHVVWRVRMAPCPEPSELDDSGND
jgi:hypothetical protein